jgi:hypothetical protein
MPPIKPANMPPPAAIIIAVPSCEPLMFDLISDCDTRTRIERCCASLTTASEITVAGFAAAGPTEPTTNATASAAPSTFDFIESAPTHPWCQ